MRKRLRVASCELRVSDWELAGARGAHLCSHNSQLATRNLPRAFTLIELMVTMVIVSIIAAAILGTANAALDSARRSRTQTVINRIHLLLMEKWETYETRRVELSPAVEAAIANVPPQWRGHALADARLLATRELMKLEMPDRWADVINANVNANDGLQWPNTPVPATYVLRAVPALTQQYYQRLISLTADNVGGVRENQGAECLYMIVMNATGDGEARTMFTDQDIGDTDGDGAPEFLDGWGQPIGFVRWPAGYVSSFQPLYLVGGNRIRQPNDDHDPFDPFRRDSSVSIPRIQQDYGSTYMWNLVAGFKNTARAADAGFATVPLVYSIGPDGDSDVFVSPNSVAGIDPYFQYENAQGQPTQLGRTYDLEGDGEGWHDNINNHSIEY